METRPKLKITLSQLDKRLELGSIILLVVMWGLTLFSFIKMPNTIPIHYNGSGQVDGYGDKITLFLLPIIATVIYFGLTQLNKYPHIFNYTTTITLENAEKNYGIATRMLRFLKFTIIIVFTSIILVTYWTTTGITKGLGTWFLPFILGLFLLQTIYFIAKSFKAK